jgi:hypothetical protein
VLFGTNGWRVEQVIPLRKPQQKQDGFVKKREEWIKNWVARKYSKPKFPSRPIPGPFTSSTVQVETEEPNTTIQPESSTKKESLLFFSPTIRPKIDPRDPSRSKSRLEPTLQPDNTRDDKSITNELKSSRLLEKYSSARQKVKNSLFHKVDKKNTTKKQRGGVPVGANTDIFRNYGGGKLSQADFERQILGVSTATEISVKSMICIKGRCFNADDMGKLLSKK